ncbi:MAG: hypothetical protein KIS94_05825 [Chitinophagales bacterium]|nr:hypothetical protein [Chitinophagales bacterium]
MKPHSAFLLLILSFFATGTNAQDVIEAATGWQTTGATRELTWRPAIQGSRKDVPVYLGWRHIGGNSLYYTPFTRLYYTNTWSIGGAMNLLSTGLSPAGLGLYFTKPPSAFEPSERVGKWFISANINAAFRFGLNITPHSPKSDKVPNPTEYKENLPWLLDHQDSLGITLFDFEQHYPFGPYGYIAVDFPVQIQFTKVLKEGYGLGFFIESSVSTLEWSLDGNRHKYALGWNMLAGLNFTFGKLMGAGGTKQ